MTTPEERVDEQPAVVDDHLTEVPTDVDIQPTSDPESAESLLDSLDHEPVDAHPRILTAVDESLTQQLSDLDDLD